MSTPTSFKWVGPKQQRASQIPPAEWAKREDRLRELHSQMTLLEVMSVMDRTQYIYQFGKWGLQKYDTAKALENGPVRRRAAPRQLPSLIEVGTATSSGPLQKRPRESIRSIETSSSDSSSLAPPFKKVNVTDEDTLPYNSHHEMGSTSSMSRSEPETCEAHISSFEGRNDEENAVFSSESPMIDWPLYVSTETSFNFAPMDGISTEAQTSSSSGPGQTITTTDPENASMGTHILEGGDNTPFEDRYYPMDEALQVMHAAGIFPHRCSDAYLIRGPSPSA
ncbi:hypothetical protein PG988_003885 [Apiospora saccharicola]